MGNHGDFGDEEVVAKWLKHSKKDREMELIQDFTYIDPDGEKWIAKKGDIINGASIPSWAWGKVLGTPFVGDYRRASVVHDVECDRRTKPYKKVHKMFYHAMRCDGVKKRKASIMYIAVAFLGGPKWDTDGKVEKESRKFKPSILERVELVMDLSLAEVGESVTLDVLEEKFLQIWNRPLQDGDELYL